MNRKEQDRALQVAVDAATSAGRLMLRHAHVPKKVHAVSQHDIKLELDVRCQNLIARRLRAAFPDTALLGEEGVEGAADAASRWVVDPIDGTVNFTYGIPHASVSVALQVRSTRTSAGYETVVGVVFDPFCGELWTARRGGAARLNGRTVRVSARARLADGVVSIGFGKEAAVLRRMVPLVERLTHRVRKIRIMGSAALALAYVASGRFDAYIEPRLSLWDIAAGGLLVECAGGEFRAQPVEGPEAYAVVASSRAVSAALRRQIRTVEAGAKRG